MNTNSSVPVGTAAISPRCKPWVLRKPWDRNARPGRDGREWVLGRGVPVVSALPGLAGYDTFRSPRFAPWANRYRPYRG